MKIAELHTEDGVQTLTIPKEFMFSDNEVFMERTGNALIITPKTSDETDYLFSKPAVARDILEGLAESWDDCVPEKEALA